MTPEEFQRNIDFIVEQLARLASFVEREHEERKKDSARLARVENAFVVAVELAEIQSRRLDSHDQEFQTLLRETKQRHDETMGYLKLILDRLPDRP